MPPVSRCRPTRVMSVAIALIALSVLLSPMPSVHAAEGDLDPSFGVGGRVTTDFGATDQVQGLAIQSDGRIVAAGTSANFFNGTSRTVLARYDLNGGLDSTFGSSGRVAVDIGVDAFSVALQPDGKIVVAGSAFLGGAPYFDWAVARFNTDGTVDSSFGLAGKVYTDFGTFDIAEDIVVQPDGKLVVVGRGDSKFAVARYNADGSLDGSFGANGKIAEAFFGSTVFANAVTLQVDGKIVVVGGIFDFAVARYNIDGSLDTSFGSGGRVVTDFSSCPGGSSQDEAEAIAVQTDGKLVVSGVSSDSCRGTSFDFAIARYNSGGTLDTSFDSDGKTVTDFFGADDNALGIVVESGGKIVAGGTTLHTFVGYEFALARFNANGSLDSTFGVGGKTTTSFGTTQDQAFDIAIQSDGKVVAAGQSAGNFALARYQGELPFDICLRDDSSGDLFQFNSSTGDYRFTNCNGLTLTGTGALTKRGSLITLQQNGPDRRLLARIDAAVNKGTVSLQVLSQGTIFTISDRNTLDNTCACLR